MGKRVLLFLLMFFAIRQAEGQFLMDMIDTTKDLGKSLFSVYKNYNHIRISGFIQPQFQLASTKGQSSFNGGDFPAHVDNRFSLRRGRLRFDYARFNKQNQPGVQFVLQFDGTERGVFIRDFWGRVFEHKWQVFAFTAGMFARPFGYELNLGSPDRESPERGRMSQLLMKTERDLGIMFSFEPRKPLHPLRHFKLDMGLFNGQGVNAAADYDSYKDFIARLSVKPYHLGSKFVLAAGLSYLNGGFLQNTKYMNRVAEGGLVKRFLLDSAASNLYTRAPRKYVGADIQLKYKSNAGFTELRAEYWQGTQTASAGTSETPASLLNEPAYIRKFNGAFIYLLHNIFNAQHQLCIKYDWYDPNTQIKAQDIGKPGTNLTVTDIKYNTLGGGYNYYINENLRLLLWYEKVINETTQLAGYTADLKDNLFTCRLQFRF
ncbi:MAG: porin [Chitinophagaceae bacterium]